MGILNEDVDLYLEKRRILKNKRDLVTAGQSTEPAPVASADAAALGLSDATMAWVKGVSYQYSNLDASGTRVDKSVHGSGHSDGPISPSTGAFVLCGLFILFLSGFYMLWRVYVQKKLLTLYYMKEYRRDLLLKYY